MSDSVSHSELDQGLTSDDGSWVPGHDEPLSDGPGSEEEERDIAETDLEETSSNDAVASECDSEVEMEPPERSGSTVSERSGSTVSGGASTSSRGTDDDESDEARSDAGERRKKQCSDNPISVNISSSSSSDSDSDMSLFSDTGRDIDDDDDDLEFSDDNDFLNFKLSNPKAGRIVLGATGRAAERRKYCMDRSAMKPKLRRDLRRLRRYLTREVSVLRGDKDPVSTATFEKLQERLRGLLGYLDEVTQGDCMAGKKPRLEEILYSHRKLWLGYFNYLNDARNLSVGTLTQHAGMVVTMLDYFLHTTGVEERKPEYVKLLATWRAFRNRLSRQHTKILSERDLDTERANGAVIPTYQELVVLTGYMQGKIDRTDGAAKHQVVQDACAITLFTMMPALRSGIWRTLQLHQDAADNISRQHYLNSAKVNYMYYVRHERTFTAQVNKNHKRTAPLTFYIREREMAKVHDLLLAYIKYHRRPLLRAARDSMSARDYLFFNPVDGRPYECPRKMATWITKIVRIAAHESGLFADRAHAIRCNPHSFRHAMYEYVRSANVPNEVRDSIAAACMHTPLTADQYYGKISLDRRGMVGRSFVYSAAQQIMDEHQPSQAPEREQHQIQPVCPNTAITATPASSSPSVHQATRILASKAPDREHQQTQHVRPRAAISATSAVPRPSPCQAPLMLPSKMIVLDASDEEEQPHADASSRSKRAKGEEEESNDTRTPRTPAKRSKPGPLMSQQLARRIKEPEIETDLVAPTPFSAVGMLAPDSTDLNPKATFAVVQHCEPIPTFAGKCDGDFRVRLAPLIEDKHAAHEGGKGYKMQIGRSYVRNASDLVYPIDYMRDPRGGGFVVFTTAKVIHQHLMGKL